MWNYRVVSREQKHKYVDSGVWLSIEEVYCDDEGNINGWTEDYNSLVGEDIDELKGSYKLVAEAFNKPVIELLYEKDKDRYYLKPIK